MPKGFSYQIISSFGDTMDDGFMVSHHRSPCGDLIVCEDTDENQDLKGITPNGKVYNMGRNAKSNSELAGATFSPDGSTLFINIQHSGLTLAINGPWHKAIA